MLLHTLIKGNLTHLTQLIHFGIKHGLVEL